MPLPLYSSQDNMSFLRDVWELMFPQNEKDYVAELAGKQTEPPFYVIPIAWLLAWLKYVDNRGPHPGEIRYDYITSNNEFKQP
jgi:hypothetical protein